MGGVGRWVGSSELILSSLVLALMPAWGAKGEDWAGAVVGCAGECEKPGGRGAPATTGCGEIERLVVGNHMDVRLMCSQR